MHFSTSSSMRPEPRKGHRRVATARHGFRAGRCVGTATGELDSSWHVARHVVDLLMVRLTVMQLVVVGDDAHHIHEVAVRNKLASGYTSPSAAACVAAYAAGVTFQ